MKNRKLSLILFVLGLFPVPSLSQQLHDAPQPKPKAVSNPRFASPRWMARHKKIAIPVAMSIGALVGWRVSSSSSSLNFTPRFHCPSTGCSLR